MALPDVAALKRVLKIEHTAEDTLVEELRARAIGLVSGAIGGVPIEAVELEMIDEAETQVSNSVGPRSLLVPRTPFDATTVEIVDNSDATLDNDDLRISASTGIIRYRDGSNFANGPYTITADVGLEHHPLYTSMLEAIVSAAIVDTVADLYYRRNPTAQSEGVAAGINRSYTHPQRIYDALAPVRQVL